MELFVGAGTNKGKQKSKNQDSIAICTGIYHKRTVTLLILCDGIGGLCKGDLASAVAVKTFTKWYENGLPLLLLLPKVLFQTYLEKSLFHLVYQLNKRYLEGELRTGKMGTTLTCLLIIGIDYYFIHIGDSRLYLIEKQLFQLSCDHNLSDYRKRLRLNNQTVQDEKRVLLQCIGSGPLIYPQFGRGTISDNVTFLLASDGFYNQLTKEELYHSFSPLPRLQEETLNNEIRTLSERVRLRGESDDSSSIAIFLNKE